MSGFSKFVDIKAIVLDFDGVIAESVSIKTEAFRELFAPYKDDIAAIMAHHHELHSSSRFVQFRAFYEKILHKPYTAVIENQLNDQFSRLVVSKIIACPFVPGAMELLRTYAQRLPLYVASLTPVKELSLILQHKGVDVFLKGYYGSEVGKAQALNDIMQKEKLTPSQIVFIGDSLSDLKAAEQTHVSFIARVHDRSFVDKEVLSFPDLNGIMNFLTQQNS